jgi:ABC-type molybdate transport system permease subunit
MKIFFAATALSLVLSTGTGIAMAWKYARRKFSVLLILAAGIALPIILLFL